MKKILLFSMYLIAALVCRAGVDGSYMLNQPLKIYMADGGELMDEPEELPADEWAEIVVADNGDGTYSFFDECVMEKPAVCSWNAATKSLTISNKQKLNNNQFISGINVDAATAIAAINENGKIPESICCDLVFTYEGGVLTAQGPFVLYSPLQNAQEGFVGEIDGATYIIDDYVLVGGGGDDPVAPSVNVGDKMAVKFNIHDVNIYTVDATATYTEANSETWFVGFEDNGDGTFTISNLVGWDCDYTATYDAETGIFTIPASKVNTYCNIAGCNMSAAEVATTINGVNGYVPSAILTDIQLKMDGDVVTALTPMLVYLNSPFDIYAGYVLGGYSMLVDGLELASLPTEFNTIDAFNFMPAGTTGKLTLQNAVVTYANEDWEFITIEDETGAMMLYGTADVVPGNKINATLEVSSYGENAAAFEPSTATFEVVGEADITTGKEVAVENATDRQNLYRLLTFKNSATSIVALEDEFGMVIGGKIGVVDYFDVTSDIFTFPAVAESVTGIMMPMPSMSADSEEGYVGLLSIRSEADVVAGEAPVEEVTEVKTVAELLALDVDGELVYLVSDNMHVVYASMGVVLIDDETGGVMVGTEDEDYEGVATSHNMLVQGKLAGYYWGDNIFEIVPEKCEFTVTEEVFAGAKVAATDIDETAHAYRLFTFDYSEECPIVRADNENGLNIGENLVATDAMYELASDFEWPEAADSVTGFVYPTNYYAYNGGRTIIAVRHADDIVAQNVAIGNLNRDNSETVIYNIFGIRINDKVENLPHGIYIINGKKVIK